MFGRGIKVFTLFGIPVYLDVSFFVIVPLFAWLLANNLHSYAQIVGLGEETSQVFGIDTSAAPEPADGARVVTPRIARPWLALVFGGLLTIGLYASVLVHEFGHALTARFWKVPTERVTLWFLGGIASLQRMPRQPGAEAIVAIAGPLTSMAVAGLCWALSFLVAPDAYLWQLIIRSLGFVNLMLA